MSQKIAELEIVIHDQASEAATKVDNLAEATKKLGDTSKGVKDVANGMTQLDKAASKTGADKLRSAVAEIEETVKKLNGALDQVNEKVGSINSNNLSSTGAEKMGDAVQETVRRVDRLSQGFVNVTKAARGIAHTILPSIVTQFGRMLKMRIMRTIVKNFLAGITEGLQNVYNWASAVGNNFKATMDGMATSALYLKNSIGAAFSSLVSLVAPHIDNLIDWLVKGINYVNMFFAVLGGKSTYIKAKKVATEYGKAASGAIGGAASAAKELKETLSVLDFDELNQLADQPTPSTGGGGGGGGGSAGADYADMFEEAKIESNWLTEKAEWLKDNFEEVLGIVSAIAAGILAWKISTDLAKNITELKDLKTTTKLGIAMFVTGLVLEATGAYELGKNGFNVKDAIITAVGTALAIGGSVLAWGTMGLTASIPLSIAILVVSYSFGKLDAVVDKLSKESESWKTSAWVIEDSVARIGRARENYTNVINSWESNVTENEDKFAQGRELLSMFRELSEKGNLNSVDLAKLQGIADAFNSLNLGEELILYFDDLDGAVQSNIDELDKLIGKYEELAMVAGYTQFIEDAYKELASLNIEKEGLQNDYNIASANFMADLQELSAMTGYDQKQLYDWLSAYRSGEYNPDVANEATFKGLTAILNNPDVLPKFIETNNSLQTAMVAEIFLEEILTKISDVENKIDIAANELRGIHNDLPTVDYGLPPNAVVQDVSKLVSKTGANAALDAAYRTQTWGAGKTEIKSPVKVEGNLFTDPNMITFTNGLAEGLDGVSVATDGVTDSANGMNGVWTNFTTTAGGGVINTTEIMANEFGVLGKTMQGTTADANTATYAYRQIGTGMQVMAIRKDFQSNLAPVYFSDTATKAKTAFESEINTTKADKNKIVPQIINPIKSGDYAGTGGAIRTAVQGAVNAITANGGTIYRSINSQITGQNYGVPGATISRAVQYEVNKTTADGGKIYRNIDSAIYAQPFSKTGGQVGADLQSGIYYGFSSRTICGAIFDGMKKAMASLPFSQIGVSMGNDIKSGIAWSLQGAQLYVQMVVGNKRTDMYGRVSAASLYAMGGFPQAGSVFIAGEQGAEAVGTINGRTGVANRDQIASAIAMALQPMLGSGGTTTTNVNVQMDSRSVARASLKGQRAMNRQFNITAQA